MAGARIQLKRATAASWASSNPVLYAGEIGYETDTNKFKIGDGTTAFNSLSYFNGNLTSSSLNDLADVTIVSASNGDFLRWNGSAWINDAVNLSTDTIGSYVESLVAGTGVSLANNSGEGATPTIAIGQDVATSASVTFAHVSAPLSGNVTGNLTGDVTGNADTATTLETARTISLGGDLSGSVSFDGSQDVTITATVEPNSVALGADTTGNYMSDVVAGTGVTVTHTPGEGSSASIAIGQAVGTTDSPSFAGVTADEIQIGVTAAGEIDTTSGNLTIDSAGGTTTLDDDVVITGNLTVSGSATYVNTEVLTIDDNVILLNSNETGSPSQNAGLEIERGSSMNVALRWNEISDKWELTEDGSTYVDIATVSYVDAQTINALDDISDVSTASVASGDFLKWNGSAWVNDQINLGTDTTGYYIASTDAVDGLHVRYIPFADVASYAGEYNNGASYANGAIVSTGVGSPYGTSGQLFIRVSNPGNPGYPPGTASWSAYSHQTSPSEGCLAVFAVDDTIMQVRVADVSNTEIGYLNGVTSAIQTQIDSKAPLDSPTFTGTVTLPDNTVALGSKTTGDYVSSIVAGTGITLSNNSGESATPTVAIGQDVATTASVTFAAVTAPLIGNASTATTLETARAISLGGDLSGSASFDGSANITITADVQPNSVALGTDTTGNYLVDVVADSSGITVNHTAGEGSSASLSLVQDINTSASVTFANVTADLVGDVTGNADTATTLETARVISLGGDLSGSVSFDGSQNVTITAAVEPNSVALGTDTTGNYVSDVVAGTAISVTHTPGEGSSASIALNAALDDLTDTVITNPEEFQTLEYNGTNWVNTYSPVVSYVRNAEATTLTTGTVVYLFGGTGDHASVKRADNSSDTTSSKTVGVVGASIAASQNGPVITRGYVDGINLSAYSVGQVLWLGTSGQFTATKPSAPDHLVFVGVVIRATNNGIIYVATQNGYELEELHDVKVISAANGDFLKYNSASAVWVNDQINLGTDTVGDYVQNLVAGTGVTLTNNSGEGSTPTVAIGQDVSTSASVEFHQLETQYDVIVGRNLYVSGSVVTENQVSLEIDDPFIYLNTTASAAGMDTGVVASYYDGSHKHAGYFRDSTDGKFKFFDSYTPQPSSPIDTDHATYSPAPVVAETFESTVTTGTAPFTVSSTTEVVNLHADTATTLHTARAISLGGDLSGSASFDGSGDINITASVEPNSVALGTDTTGNYMVGLAEGTGITITHTPGEGSTASVSLNATLDNLTDVSVAAPTDGYFLKYVSASSAWVPAAIPTINNLDDVGDVTITSASAGQFLQWNGSAWVNALPSSTTVADSAPASPSEGDIWFDSTTLDTFIRYDSAWLQINAEPSIEDLNDLFDVNVQSPQPNDFLKYDGTEWVASSSIIPVAISSKTVDYTLTMLDANKLIEMNSGSANTLTIPTNATVALPVGTRVEVVQRGAGKTEIAGAAGVTIRSYIGTYIAGQYGCATLIKRANNEWYVFGDLSAT